MLNLRHIEVFHAIMRTGSVTAAAKALNVSQPAVSAVLKHLESRIRMPLFIRVNGRLKATSEAEALVPDISEIFHRLNAVERLAMDLAGGLRGSLSIAATSPIANGFLTKILADFTKHRPELRTAIQSLSSPLVLERVLNREVDVGVAYEPIVSPEVETEIFSRGSIACVLPKAHPLANQALISLADLQPHPIITYMPQALLRPYVDKAMSDAGVSLNITTEVGQSITGIMLAMQGAGVALVEPGLLSAMNLPDIVCRPLVPRVEVKSLLMLNRTAPKSKVLNEFVEHVRRQARMPLE